MAYTVVRTDKMAGQTLAPFLSSARFQVGGENTEIMNGSIVELKGLMEGEREIYLAETPNEASLMADLALVATPEVVADPRLKRLSDFINEAGSAIRCYRLHSGDIFSVSPDGIEGSASVGAAVSVGAGLKPVVGGSGTAIGSIIEIDNDFVVIQID